MRSAVRVGVHVVACVVAVALCGCAVVDQYSGRAIAYNLEAEQAQDQAMLLNIVRAYLRRPMQFTTVSTITGTATASGSVSYTLPTNVPFRPPTQGATGIAGFPPLPTWLFGGSMSGGPAFTVPVLDTQEFYQGILKAIPGQIWDLYLQANYPPDLLFNLFVQRIVIRHKSCTPDDHAPKCEFTFYNYVAKDIQIKLFQKFTDYLLWFGLTTEAPTAKPVPFDHPTNVNIRYVGAPGKVDADNIPTAEVVAPPGGAASGDAPAAAPKAYKLCFAPRHDIDLIDPSSLCGHGAAVEEFNDVSRELNTVSHELESAKQKLRGLQPGEQQWNELTRHIGELTKQQMKLIARRLQLTARQSGEFFESELSADKATITVSGRATGSLHRVDSKLITNLKVIASCAGHSDCIVDCLERHDCPPQVQAVPRCMDVRQDVRCQLESYFGNGSDIEFTIYMRNTEGMIYYLGEVVRRALVADLEPGRKQWTFVKRGSPYDAYKWETNCVEPTETCNYVFRVIAGDVPALGDMMSIHYDGLSYSVAGSYDPEKPDLSTLTLEFMKQLLAINSSAKSLPQSSVVTTVSP